MPELAKPDINSFVELMMMMSYHYKVKGCFTGYMLPCFLFTEGDTFSSQRRICLQIQTLITVGVQMINHLCVSEFVSLQHFPPFSAVETVTLINREAYLYTFIFGAGLHACN